VKYVKKPDQYFSNNSFSRRTVKIIKKDNDKTRANYRKPLKIGVFILKLRDNKVKIAKTKLSYFFPK